MKKLSLFIAFAMLAALTMVSCNNKPKEPTQEEVQEMKQALADSVLAEIDAIANEYFVVTEKGIIIRSFELTEKEKKIKPDYLLDPSEANKFVTKSQKVSALAIYVMELDVRELYGMPTEESKTAIAKLAAEVNFPFLIDRYEANVPMSESIKEAYEKCRENGELALFWQFEYAVIAETSYLLVENPELVFSRISDEQMQYYCQKYSETKKVLTTLAKYDEEIADLLEFQNSYKFYSSNEERLKINSSVEAAKQYRMANKDKYIARRNALLQ